jgi:hypothetical protein
MEKEELRERRGTDAPATDSDPAWRARFLVQASRAGAPPAFANQQRLLINPSGGAREMQARLSFPGRVAIRFLAMFANLLQLLSGQSPSRTEYDHAFVREVTVKVREPRNRRLERWLIVGWILIAAKSALMFWVVDRYRVPLNAWWINGPTVMLALLCTYVYARRR